MELQLVVFSLAGEDFGVPIDQVREIIRFTAVTKVPKAPVSVLGVINLRGRVIPVVSLRERFGFPAEEAGNATRIVVSDLAGQTAGFVVDAVTEVLRLDEGAIEPPPASASTVDSAFIKGIGKIDERLIILLDLEKVFDFSVLARLTPAASA
ncbi:MAG TPA: chemotaxis protein CheW [Firmicutes bacterium]|nr:chemotaxis protein CheW [Bacillota bacterium]